MAEIIAKTGVKKEEGYLYFMDKAGDVSRAKMARVGVKGGKPEKVVQASVKREEGYLYFIDKKGNIARTKMARGRKASKKKK